MFKKFGGLIPGLYFDGDGTGNSGGSGGAATFTQEQMNAIIGDRVRRAEESALGELFKAFGVKTADDLKAIVEDGKKAKAEKQTDLEKLQADLAAANQKATDLESDYQAKLAEANKRLLDGDIRAGAALAVKDDKGKVTRPAFRPDALDDVLVLVDRSLIVEKDGTTTGIAEALEALAKAKPYLLAEAVTPKGDGKGTPGGGNQKPPAGSEGQNNQAPRSARSLLS